MQLPAVAAAPRTETLDDVACRLKHGRKMEDDVIGFLESVNRIVELKVTECRRCWEDYVKSFANYTSVIRINGKPLLPPVMNPDRREAMRACRVRLTSTASRHKGKRKDLMAKVEFALDDVGSLDGCHAAQAAGAAASTAQGDVSPERCPHGRIDAAAAVDAVPRQSVMVRQHLGGAERSALAHSGTRRSSSCGNLYQHATTTAAAAASAAGSAVEPAEPAKRTASPSSGRPGDGDALGRCQPSPPVGTPAASAAAVSRNRLAVRYMSVGTGAAPMFRQPFFLPVASTAVQTKASLGPASATSGFGTVEDGQRRLLDRVALAASCDGELDADVEPSPAAAGGAGACNGSIHGTVGSSAHGPDVARHHAVYLGERREADGKAAGGEEGDSVRASLHRLRQSTVCRQVRPVENGDCSEAVVAVSQASLNTTTLTADTNLPSHLRSSASSADTLTASTTLGHDAELAASCGSFHPDDRGGTRSGGTDTDLATAVRSSKGSASVWDLPSAAAALQSPPKLLRSNSYTLKSPSPALLKAQLSGSKEPAAATVDAGEAATMAVASGPSKDARNRGPVADRGTDGSLAQAFADRRGGGEPRRSSAQRRLAFMNEQPAADSTAGVPPVAVSATQRGMSVPHHDENGVDSDGTLGRKHAVIRQQSLLQPQSSDTGLRRRRRRSASTADEDDDDDDGEEVTAEARRGLVLLKSKFHDRLLMRMRGTPLLGADYRRPSTALPLDDGRMCDAPGEPLQPPARPSTATGLASRRAASPASDPTMASDSVVTSECSQWLALPEADVCIVGSCPTDPVGNEAGSTCSRDGLSALAACIKGYLTRRLLETEKVKFLVKTVQDCQQLLVNLNNQKYRIAASSKVTLSAAGMDAGLRERIAAQLTSALGQLHDLFFVAPVQKRMALIGQHRVLESERKFNALMRSNSAETRRQRISAAASSAAEKRNLE